MVKTSPSLGLLRSETISAPTLTEKVLHSKSFKVGSAITALVLAAYAWGSLDKTQPPTDLEFSNEQQEDGVVYTFSEGETPWDVAARYAPEGVDVGVLAAELSEQLPNGATQVRPGDSIRLTGELADRYRMAHEPAIEQ